MMLTHWDPFQKFELSPEKISSDISSIIQYSTVYVLLMRPLKPRRAGLFRGEILMNKP